MHERTHVCAYTGTCTHSFLEILLVVNFSSECINSLTQTYSLSTDVCLFWVTGTTNKSDRKLIYRELGRGEQVNAYAEGDKYH